MTIIKDFIDSFKSKFIDTEKSLDSMVTKSITGRSLQWLIDNRSGANNNIIYPAKNSQLIFSCIQIIGDNVPDADLKFYDIRTDNELLPNDDVVSLFSMPDGDNMTWFDFLSASAVYYAMYGECFWVMVPSDGQMNPDINYSLPAKFVVVDPKTLTHILDHEYNLTGWLYAPSDQDNTIKKSSLIIPKDLVIQTKNINPYSNWRGLSVIDSLKTIIDMDYKGVTLQSRSFDNGAIPAAVITMDKDVKTISKKQALAIVKEMDKRHKGVDKYGKTGIIGPGMGIEVLGAKNRDMQFIDMLQYTRDNILAAFRIHKTVLGFTEGINRATVKEQREMLWDYTLKPITKRIQASINYKFLNKFYPTARCAFDYSKLIESQKLTVSDIPILRDLGYTRNEINTRLELKFDEDSEGDIRRYPFNLQESGVDEKPENINKPNKKKILQIEDTNNDDATEIVVNKAIKKSNGFHNIYVKTQINLEKMFRGRVKKFGIRQRSIIIKSVYNDIKSIDVNKDVILGRIKDIFDGVEDELLEKVLTPAYNKVMEESGEMAYNFMGLPNNYIIDSEVLFDKVNKIKGINKTTYNQIKISIDKGMEAGESLDQIAKRIKGVYSDFNGYRSKRIARTETGSLISKTSQKEYIMNGVMYKSWTTAGDENVREEHAANEAQGKIPINESFSNGEQFPNDTSMDCRCSLIPEI